MKNLWRTSKTPLIKVTFYPNGTYKVSSKVYLLRHRYYFRTFCVQSGDRYKSYCNTTNPAYRSTSLALIQMDWWQLCCYLKSVDVIKDSSQFKMEFIEPEEPVYRVLGGLDEESCM